MNQIKFFKYNSIYKEYYLFRTFIFLLIIVLVNLISITNVRNLNNYISEIHLVIKGKGTQNILNNDFNTNPSEVIVNGISKVNSCIKTCDLDEDINKVTIKFEEQIKSCNKMFNNLQNIIEIDLSNFDASEVITMEWMFYYCKNLEKINFGNINTSSVEKMNKLFYKCEKLISIDLSNFDTSKVNNMEWMFADCINLKYLDLSNFDTLNLIDMSEMFYNCQSLIYLNLNSFHLNESVKIVNILNFISPYVKICANDETIINKFSTISKKSNCTDKCFTPNIKIDIKNNQCIESCLNNKYELNNICYKECPKVSFLLSDKELNDYNFENIKECYDKAYERY